MLSDVDIGRLDPERSGGIAKKTEPLISDLENSPNGGRLLPIASAWTTGSSPTRCFFRILCAQTHLSFMGNLSGKIEPVRSFEVSSANRKPSNRFLGPIRQSVVSSWHQLQALLMPAKAAPRNWCLILVARIATVKSPVPGLPIPVSPACTLSVTDSLLQDASLPKNAKLPKNSGNYSGIGAQEREDF